MGGGRGCYGDNLGDKSCRIGVYNEHKILGLRELKEVQSSFLFCMHAVYKV